VGAPRRFQPRSGSLTCTTCPRLKTCHWYGSRTIKANDPRLVSRRPSPRTRLQTPHNQAIVASVAAGAEGDFKADKMTPFPPRSSGRTHIRSKARLGGFRLLYDEAAGAGIISPLVGFRRPAT